MPTFRHAFIISLTSLGLAACGGDSDSGNSAATANTPGASSAIPVAGADACNPASETQTVDTAWSIDTGAHAPDQIDTANFLPVAIDLATLNVSSTAACLQVSTPSDTVTQVSLAGTPVITLTREAQGLSIRSQQLGNTRVAYHLSGQGTTPITLHSEAPYKLVLNNASLVSPDGPALNLQSAQTAHVELHGSNSLSDSAAWTARTLEDGSEMDQKATLFAEGAIVIRGTGSLDIKATPQHALASDAHVRLGSGTVSLHAAAKDGLRANDAFIMDGGALSITTPAGKGIKVDGREDATQPLGFVAINEGQLTINSYDKALTAAWKTKDAKTEATTDDPDPRVTINGGTIDITTTGPVKDDSADTPETADAPSPEGIEAKSAIVIKNGNIRLNTQDDSLNAGTLIDISGGRIYAHSALNDSLDSNGPMRISGGLLVATSQAPNPEGALDSDSNGFVITGGTVIGLGYYNSTPSAEESTQNIVTVTNGLNNSVEPGLWTLRDASGNAAFSFQVPFAASYMTLSSPLITTGATYTVVTGGTLGAVQEDFNGLAIGPTTHTGGTAGTSFVVENRLTALGTPFEWPAAGAAP